MTNTGAWRGYWEQRAFGRQRMHDLALRFNGGAMHGQGVDCIGRFTFEGNLRQLLTVDRDRQAN